MATNITFEDHDQLLWTVGAGIVAGDPVLIGSLVGVALTDADSANKAVVKTRGVADLTVEAVDNVGANAVAEGDVLYYDSAATIKINKDVTNGKPFGIARAAIASGSAVIGVALGTGIGS